jgi:hypothetical protein
MDEAARQAAGWLGHPDRHLFDKELAALCFSWDTAYDIQPGDEPWTAEAARKDDPATVLRGTPDALHVLIADDYAARRVSRDIAP